MGLLEGEPRSRDKDTHYKAGFSDDHQENDVLLKDGRNTNRGPHDKGKSPHLLISGSLAKVKYVKTPFALIFTEFAFNLVRFFAFYLQLQPRLDALLPE